MHKNNNFAIFGHFWSFRSFLAIQNWPIMQNLNSETCFGQYQLIIVKKFHLCSFFQHIRLLDTLLVIKVCYVHCSTLAGSRFVHQVTLSVHSSTLAGSRVVHQFSHRSTFLHLLGPELYTSFLTGPLFYTCWVHDSTLGFHFNFWSILLHQLGPELYTSIQSKCISLDPASV